MKSFGVWVKYADKDNNTNANKNKDSNANADENKDSNANADENEDNNANANKIVKILFFIFLPHHSIFS